MLPRNIWNTSCGSMAMLEFIQSIYRNIPKDFFEIKSIPNTKSINLDFTFSEDFYRNIGVNNLINVSGLEDSEKRELFYTGFLNLRANADSCNPYTCLGEINCEPFKGVYPGKDGFLSLDFIPKWMRDQTDNKKIESTIDYITWINKLKSEYYLSNYEAKVVLSKLVGIAYKYIFTIEKHIPSCNIVKQNDLRIPSDIRYPLWSSKTPSFILHNYKTILSFSDDILSVIAQYKFGNEDFCIFVPQSNNRLAFGAEAPIAYFFNGHLFENFPTATIFIFQDARVAFQVQDRLDDLNYDCRNIIISSVMGDNFSLYPWSFLRGHKSIYIPAPTLRGIDNILQFENCCNEIGINDYAVSKQFVLREHEIESGFHKELGSKAEEYIFNNTIFLTEKIDLLSLLDKIEAESMPLRSYRNKYTQLGIFKNSGYNISEDVKRKLEPEAPDPRLLPLPALKLEDVTANHILRPQNSIMVVGAKNAGKTQEIFLQIKSILQIEDKIFPFNNFSHASLGNVCLVDAETPYDELQNNIRIHGLNEFEGNKLQIFSRLNPVDQTFEDYDLTNPNFRHTLKEKLIEFRCGTLILDNLTALMGNKVDNASYAQDVIEWFEQLQKINICVVFVLHKSYNGTKIESDRNRGSQLFRSRARVIINLISKTEIKHLNEAGINIPANVLQAASGSGLTMGIEFTACKTAPILEGYTIWAKMPEDQSFELLSISGTDGEEVNLERVHPQTSLFESVLKLYPCEKHTTLTELSEKELKVIYALSCCNGIARINEIVSKIENSKGLGEDTVRKLLQSLSTLGLIEDIGETKQSRRYKILR